MKKLAATVLLVSLGLIACDKSGTAPASSSSSSAANTAPATSAAPATSTKTGGGW